MRKLFYFLIAGLTFYGCSEDYSSNSYLLSTPDTYVNLMERGWNAFEQGNFQAAADYFQTAADRDATKPEPYLGLGWTFARSTNADLETAMKDLSKTLAFALFDPDLEAILNNESNAGKAVISYAMGNYQDAIDHANLVLAASPNFSMRFDASINADYLVQLQLNSNFNLGDINAVYKTLVAMGTTFSTVTSVASDPIQVTLDDELTGLHTGTLALTGDAPGLIDVSNAVVGTAPDEIIYSIVTIDVGSDSFTLSGNPLIPADADVYVTYDYAQNYGSFIDELLEHLSNQ